MNIPFVDLKSQYNSIKDEIHDSLNEVLENTAFIGGKKFEENYKKLYNVKDCISCGNGTDAIYLALKALGIGYGDEVIVPANTFVASAEPVSQVGANPVFVDCDEDFYHFDIDKIQEKITPRTKAIIPVHLYGQAVNMPKILEVAKKNKLFVIEDCAQSHLSTYDNQLTGTFGDIATFSFYPGKNLGAFGDAGAVITNNEELGNKVRALANHGGLKKYQHDIEGMNSRMDGIQAAVLNVKLNYIAQWTESRRQNANHYDNYLSGISEIETPKRQNNSDHVFHLYVIRAERRDELSNFLNENGIATGLHYPLALPYMKAYSRFNHIPEDFPNAYMQQSKILSLPIFAELTEESIKFISQKIKEFYKVSQ